MRARIGSGWISASGGSYPYLVVGPKFHLSSGLKLLADRLLVEHVGRSTGPRCTPQTAAAPFPGRTCPVVAAVGALAQASVEGPTLDCCGRVTRR